jgi:hypothetical protein
VLAIIDNAEDKRFLCIASGGFLGPQLGAAADGDDGGNKQTDEKE